MNNKRKELGPHPEFCEKCSKLMENSEVKWVICGGLHIGHHVQPLVWSLRSKKEEQRMAEATKHLQQIASAARILHKAKESGGLSDELVLLIDNWNERN